MTPGALAIMNTMAENPQLTRDQSLDTRPVAVKILAREPLEGGGERITVPYQPSGWTKFILRVPETATKKYELDALGVEILDYCDGEKSVRHMASLFAKRHKVDKHEAERAVISFLETLVKRGVIVLVVPK
jgi:hypothetical protein